MIGPTPRAGVRAYMELMGRGEVIMATVPNKPKTPVSAFRIPLDLKAAAQARAKERGENLTAVVIRALERYVEEGDK